MDSLDRWTDNMRSQDRALHYSALRSKNQTDKKKTADNGSPKEGRESVSGNIYICEGPIRIIMTRQNCTYYDDVI